MGNLHVPTLLGFVDFATSRLNNLAFWLSVLSVQLLVVAMAFETGVSAGWTLYFPLTGIDFSSSHAVSLAILSLHPRSVVRSRCDYLFGNIATGQKFWCIFLELRPCRLSNFPRFDLARDHLAYPWSRNHGPIFRTAFRLFGTIGTALGCCWRCRCISTSFLVLWTS